MDCQKIEEYLEAIIGLDQMDPQFDEFEPPQTVSTFDGVGLMTSNRGLVLRMADGSEFQVSIVRSR